MAKMILKNEMRKKAQETSIGTIMWIIIALIIVALIMAFLFFGNNIWDYFKNLPGYKYSNKDKVIDNITKDERILANYYMVGVINNGKNIKFCTSGDCSENKLRTSNLYWSGDERDGGIYVDESWAIDKKIGVVVNNRITIDAEVLNGGNLYSNVENLLPDYADLINLDNSIYISGIIYRDKGVVVNEGDKIYGKTLIEMPADRSASFSEKVKNLNSGEVLEQGGYFVFESSGMFSSENINCNKIKIEKVGENEYKLSALYTKDNKEIWHEIDCNKGGWFGKTLMLDNFKETLANTLNDNCKW